MSGRDAVRAELEALFAAALRAVEPAAAVGRVLESDAHGLHVAGEPLPEAARLVVLAAGKAAAPMARAVEAIAGDRIAAGLAVTREGHGLPLQRIVLREAGHPVPDARCEAAAREALALVASARPDDVLLVLLSGGASSLLACPLPGLSLADLSATTSALLSAGADIAAVNAVRKHLTALSGGRLARHARCDRIHVLAISDVRGDRLDVIGSGPCAPDPSRFGDARDVAADAGSGVPPAVLAHLDAGMRGEVPETPKPGDRALARVRHTLVARNADALEGARREAEQRGLRSILLPDALHGEARVAGRRLAALGLAAHPTRPQVWLAGGETTVTLRGPGRGGRSQELALAAALQLDTAPGVSLLAAGTDGTDGPTDAAGAFVDGMTRAHGTARGVDAVQALASNDSYGFFSRAGGLFRTGPTRTNVMDLALLHLEPAASPRPAVR